MENDLNTILPLEYLHLRTSKINNDLLKQINLLSDDLRELLLQFYLCRACKIGDLQYIEMIFQLYPFIIFKINKHIGFIQYFTNLIINQKIECFDYISHFFNVNGLIRLSMNLNNAGYFSLAYSIYFQFFPKVSHLCTISSEKIQFTSIDMLYSYKQSKEFLILHANDIILTNDKIDFTQNFQNIQFFSNPIDFILYLYQCECKLLYFVHTKDEIEKHYNECILSFI